MIYPRDHKPPHVHVLGPGAEARFEIKTLKCLSNHGFSMRALREIKRFLAQEKENLLEKWNEYQE
jgi:hypothetical protein